MNKKITLCLLSLFFNTSFAQDCLEPNDLVENQEMKLLNAKKVNEEVYRGELGIGIICNSLYIARAIYLLCKYLDNKKQMAIYNVNDTDEDFYLESMAIVFQGDRLLKPNDPDYKELKGGLYKTWLVTYGATQAIFLSKTTYKFVTYLKKVKQTGSWL